jgi:tagaturonate epimerase
MEIGRYSMGIGDRFARQGRAQLAAFVEAKKRGVEISPVWNKSNREHKIIGSEPESVRAEADAAVAALGWQGKYYVDADHIGLKTVDWFIGASDFYTLDVADFTGKAAASEDISAFVKKFGKYAGKLSIPGLEGPIKVSKGDIETIAKKYLLAAKEAAGIYRRVEKVKGAGSFVTEVSMDETDLPQTPVELFFILAAIADAGIPAQTIAPKFTGRFNKGVDYVGNVAKFAREFDEDLCVISFAVKEFGLPAGLKLSVHSGSDKFSLYGPMKEALRKRNAGLHLKTAGTTWLEEVAGLAASGGEGLALAKEIYASALARAEELKAPYATVIDIDHGKLPSAAEVKGWDAAKFEASLIHDESCRDYNPHMRQLVHVAFKVAAELGDRYLGALDANEAVVAKGVTKNLLERHIAPLFLD